MRSIFTPSQCKIARILMDGVAAPRKIAKICTGSGYPVTPREVRKQVDRMRDRTGMGTTLELALHILHSPERLAEIYN